MTAPHADQLIEGYVARLSAAASDLPKSARQELIDDVRSHIERGISRDQASLGSLAAGGCFRISEADREFIAG